jgi:NitT/TauT family transport system ATP-binding protein
MTSDLASTTVLRPAAEGVSVSVRSLNRTFATRKGDSVIALHNVEIDIAPGEFISVVGPSGCGKSTLLMILAGLQIATSGTVHLDGELIVEPSPLMGIAFQRDNLLEWRTVLDNVLAQVELRGMQKSAWRGRAHELLAMVGLASFEHSYPRELSGGMRQRVSLCRALVHEPRILLLDEPFGAVDAMTREQLNLDVARLCAYSGVTALLVTHDINEAAFMGERVIVMTPRPGRIAGEIVVGGEPSPRSAEFRLSDEFLDATRRVRVLLESGATA